nr:MAG TPA: hypothetical protein [Caudoviricetes sp.]
MVTILKNHHSQRACNLFPYINKYLINFKSEDVCIE